MNDISTEVLEPESNNRRTVEIGGRRFEVDMTTAKEIREYKIGDKVKILIKEYSDSYKTHPGVIVGFDNFEKLPTVIIAYIASEYNNAELKFVYLNSKTEDKYEILPMSPMEQEPIFTKAMAAFENKIEIKQRELEDMIRKRDFFKANYDADFALLERQAAGERNVAVDDDDDK